MSALSWVSFLSFLCWRQLYSLLMWNVQGLGLGCWQLGCYIPRHISFSLAGNSILNRHMVYVCSKPLLSTQQPPCKLVLPMVITAIVDVPKLSRCSVATTCFAIDVRPRKFWMDSCLSNRTHLVLPSIINGCIQWQGSQSQGSKSGKAHDSPSTLQASLTLCWHPAFLITMDPRFFSLHGSNSCSYPSTLSHPCFFDTYMLRPSMMRQ